MIENDVIYVRAIAFINLATDCGLAGTESRL